MINKYSKLLLHLFNNLAYINDLQYIKIKNIIIFNNDYISIFIFIYLYYCVCTFLVTTLYWFSQIMYCPTILYIYSLLSYVCPLCSQGRSACRSDCTLALHHKGEMLNYDFSPLANVTGFQSSPRFTSKGLQYFHHFSVALCGTEVREYITEVCSEVWVVKAQNETLKCVFLSFRTGLLHPVWKM